MKRTSREWWQAVRQDEALLIDWLKKQYHAERKACDLIDNFLRDHVAPESKWRATIERIAEQEQQHAASVGELLIARGETPKLLDKRDRYWEQALPGIVSFESGAAVAAHVEELSLERLVEIAHDPEIDEDIRRVFLQIYKDEQFHARAFRKMAGEQAFGAATERHLAGLDAIGLIAAT